MNKLVDLVQLLTDPENQPHQFVGHPNALIALMKVAVDAAYWQAGKGNG